MIANRRRTTKRSGTPFKHRPLSANQIAAVVDWITTPHEVTVTEKNAEDVEQSRTYTRQGNAVYALAVLFAAHTGIRAAELQGLQVQDVTLSSHPATVGSIRVVRTGSA